MSKYLGLHNKLLIFSSCWNYSCIFKQTTTLCNGSKQLVYHSLKFRKHKFKKFISTILNFTNLGQNCIKVLNYKGNNEICKIRPGPILLLIPDAKDMLPMESTFESSQLNCQRNFLERQLVLEYFDNKDYS